MADAVHSDLRGTYLPTGRMLQVSDVLFPGDGRIVGQLILSPDHWVFADHFRGDPIFPGSLLIEAAGQILALGAWYGGSRGRPRLVRARAAFHRPIGPGTGHVHLDATFTSRRNLHFGTIRILAEGEEAGMVEAALAVLPPLSQAFGG